MCINVSRQGGIVVHTEHCPNNAQLEEKRKIDVFWAQKIDRKYPALLKIVGTNGSNFLFKVVTTINAANVSVAEMNSQTNNNLETTIKLKVLTENLSQLERLIANIKKISDVYSVERDFR